MFISAFLFHSTNQSIKLQALLELHYPPLQLPQELQLQHHAMVSHRPLRSGKPGRLSDSALTIATLQVLSATLLVTGSWQGPIRACTRKQREANEIFLAVLLLLSQHRRAEPIRSQTSPFLLIVCVLAFVSTFVRLYCVSLIPWPTFRSLLSQRLAVVLNQIKLINVLLI